MKEEYVRDFYGRIIGIYRYKPNGDIEAVDFQTRKILGYYRAKRDITTDFYNRILNHGNMLSTLFKTRDK